MIFIMGFTRNEDNYPIQGSGEWLEKFANGRLKKESAEGPNIQGEPIVPDAAAAGFIREEEKEEMEPPVPEAAPTEVTPEAQPEQADFGFLQKIIQDAWVFSSEIAGAIGPLARLAPEIRTQLMPGADQSISEILRISEEYSQSILNFNKYLDSIIQGSNNPTAFSSSKIIKTSAGGLASNIVDFFGTMVSNLDRNKTSVEEFKEAREILNGIMEKGKQIESQLSSIPQEMANLPKSMETIKAIRGITDSHSSLLGQLRSLLGSYDKTSIGDARKGNAAFYEDQKNQDLTKRVQEGVQQPGETSPGVKPPGTEETQPAAPQSQAPLGKGPNQPANQEIAIEQTEVKALVSEIMGNIESMKNIILNIDTGVLMKAVGNNPQQIISDINTLSMLVTQHLGSYQAQKIEEIQIQEI